MRDPGPGWALAGAAIGLIAVSHAVVFIRLAEPADPILIAAVRMGVAALVVLPISLRLSLPEWRGADKAELALAALAGLLLAAHFAVWIASLSLTSIVNSTALVTLNPVWIALYGLFLGRMRPTRLAWASIALAVGGAMLMGWGSARHDAGVPGDGAGRLTGDFLALLGGMLMAAYLVIGQRVRARLTLFAYVGICYPAAALALWLAVPAMGAWSDALPAGAWLAMLALGLVSQIIGHTAYNWTLKALSPGFIALCLLGEPVLGALFGMIYFAEYPGPWTWAGGVAILGGVALGLRAERRPS